VVSVFFGQNACAGDTVIFVIDEAEIAVTELLKKVSPMLDERQQRLFAGAAARSIGLRRLCRRSPSYRTVATHNLQGNS